MNRNYLKKLTDDWVENLIENDKKLLKQSWPTCWLISFLNNFILNNDVKITNSFQKKYIKYIKWLWIDVENKWWHPLYSALLFTEYWNDVLQKDPIVVYYIEDISQWEWLTQFVKMMHNHNIFQYTRSSWLDFKEDRKDFLINQTDYEDTDSWHAVNIGRWEYWNLKEYWSYWEDNKYNILWITPKAFAGLLKNDDLKKTVYIVKYM